MRTMLSLLILLTIFSCTSLSAQFEQQRDVYGVQGNGIQWLRMSASGEENIVASTEVFNNDDHTTGRRFLMNTWSKGSNMLDENNELINVSQYFFNYDMLTGNVIVTENKKKIMSIAPTRIRSILLENSGKKFPLVHVPLIDSNGFFLYLTGNDSAFTLYKKCKVRFVKADYRNDGLIQTGNPDDQYIDESTYYITRPNEKTFRQISLKPKDIKNLLVSEKEKVSHYFSDHSDDEINEGFLTGLINTINKK